MPLENSGDMKTFITQPNERMTLNTAIALITIFGSLRPKIPLIRKPMNGSAGMSQRFCISSASVPKCVDFVDVQCGAILEHRQDNRQSHRGFSGRDDHHEKRE